MFMSQELIFDLYKDEATDRLFLPKFFKELVEAGIRKDDPRLEQMIRQVKESEHLEEEILVDTHNLQLDREAFKRFENLVFIYQNFYKITCKTPTSPVLFMCLK